MLKDIAGFKASGVFVEQKLASRPKTRSPFAPDGRKRKGRRHQNEDEW